MVAKSMNKKVHYRVLTTTFLKNHTITLILYVFTALPLCLSCLSQKSIYFVRIHVLFYRGQQPWDKFVKIISLSVSVCVGPCGMGSSVIGG